MNKSHNHSRALRVLHIAHYGRSVGNAHSTGSASSASNTSTACSSRSANSTRSANTGRILYPAIAIALLIFTWQLLITCNIVPSYLLPSPLAVAQALAENTQVLTYHSLITIAEALIGLIAGIAFGVLGAIIMDWAPLIKKALRPLVTLSQSVPTIAIAPLLVLWLGYGMLPKIVLVALTCFFPIAISLLEGFASLAPDQLELMQTMRATKAQIFWHLKIPASILYFFSGLKVGAAYAIVGAVIAEWMGGIAGLGVFMTRVRKSYAYDDMFACILVIALLSLSLVALVNLAERYLVPWLRPRKKNGRPVATMLRRIWKPGMHKTAIAILASVTLIGALVPLALCGGPNASKSDDPAQQAQSTSSSSTAPADFQNITLVLDYTPNTNHLGIYAAQELGYYAQEGLNVQIVQPPEDGAETMVGAGKAEYGVSYQDTLANFLFAKETVPITAVAAILQHNTSGIMSAPSAHINRPRDLEGKAYATMQSATEEAILKELVEADGGDFSKVKLVPAGTTDEVSGLREGLFDAIWSFSGWGLQNAALQNAEVNFQPLTDFNDAFDYYTPVLIGNNAFLAQNPGTAKRFLAATAKGYVWAAEHPQEAAKILVRAVPETDSALAEKSAEVLASEFISDAPFWGYIDQNRWTAFYTWLDEKGLLQTPLTERTLAWSGGFTNDFLTGAEG